MMSTLDLSETRLDKFTHLEITARFAKCCNAIIEPLLIGIPNDWHLVDRILCHYCPEYKKNVQEFYESDGPMLLELLSSEEIDLLDEKCLKHLKESVSYPTGFISKNDLIANFYMVKEKLGRVPTSNELEEQGIFSLGTYKNRFGRFNSLLEELGEEHSLRSDSISREDLVTNFYMVKEKLGRVPSLDELGEQGNISIRTYNNRFGGYNNLLEELGENPLPPHNFVDQEDLIRNFYMVKEKLGRVPNLTELGELGIFGQRTYHKKFGGYRKLLEMLGETAPPYRKHCSAVKKKGGL